MATSTSHSFSTHAKNRCMAPGDLESKDMVMDPSTKREAIEQSRLLRLH
jgi:hypothetical protein